jgi:hypothetical protein
MPDPERTKLFFEAGTGQPHGRSGCLWPEACWRDLADADRAAKAPDSTAREAGYKPHLRGCPVYR